MDQSHTKRGFQAAEYAAENRPKTAIKLRVHIAVGTGHLRGAIIDHQSSIMIAGVDIQEDGGWPDHSRLAKLCVDLGYPTMYTAEIELPTPEADQVFEGKVKDVLVAPLATQG